MTVETPVLPKAPPFPSKLRKSLNAAEVYSSFGPIPQIVGDHAGGIDGADASPARIGERAEGRGRNGDGDGERGAPDHAGQRAVGGAGGQGRTKLGPGVITSGDQRDGCDKKHTDAAKGA